MSQQASWPSYRIPDLEMQIHKAYKDLYSRDVMAQRLYLNQVLNFILDWLSKQMSNGLSLFEAEQIVR